MRCQDEAIKRRSWMEIHMPHVPNGKRAFLKGTVVAMAMPLLLTAYKSTAEALPPVLLP